MSATNGSTATQPRQSRPMSPEQQQRLAKIFRELVTLTSSHQDDVMESARMNWTNAAVRPKATPVPRPDTVPISKEEREAVDQIKNIILEDIKPTMYNPLGIDRTENLCLSIGGTAWENVQRSYDRSREKDPGGGPSSRVFVPTVDGEMWRKAGESCHHEDRDAVEPLQLVYMFCRGTAFDNEGGMYLQLADCMRTASNEHSIMKKMKAFELSTQAAIVDRALLCVQKMVKKTGGIAKWQEHGPEWRSAAFRRIFDTNPVAIADAVFASMAEKIAFPIIFASDDSDDNRMWQLFTREKFALLCSAVYDYMVDWQGELSISGRLVVYDVLRDTGMIKIKGMDENSWLRLPVSPGRGRTRKPTV